MIYVVKVMSCSEEKLIDIHHSSIGKILTLAEAALPSPQFRAFKKLVLDHHHRQIKPQIREVFKKRSGQASGISDSLDKKGCAL